MTAPAPVPASEQQIRKWRRQAGSRAIGSDIDTLLTLLDQERERREVAERVVAIARAKVEYWCGGCEAGHPLTDRYHIYPESSEYYIGTFSENDEGKALVPCKEPSLAEALATHRAKFGEEG